MIMKKIKQSELTGECWTIQFMGLKACEKCEFLDTPDCGGQEIRQKLENKKGYEVPLRDYSAVS